MREEPIGDQLAAVLQKVAHRALLRAERSGERHLRSLARLAKIKAQDMPQEPIGDQLATMIQNVASEALRRTERSRKRHFRSLVRIAKIGALLWFSTIAIVVGMIATGNLFGPTGAEGWLLTPLMLLVTWAAILYAFRKRKLAPPKPQSRDLPQLAQQVTSWLEEQHPLLPPAAQSQLDSITLQLQSLAPQLRELDPARPAAAELRRLIGEELPELMEGYRKVPAAFRNTPLHGGPTPDRQLIDGLTTVGAELGRVHARIATDDLHALATQHRYLDAKYKRDEPIE